MNNVRSEVAEFGGLFDWAVAAGQKVGEMIWGRPEILPEPTEGGGRTGYYIETTPVGTIKIGKEQTAWDWTKDGIGWVAGKLSEGFIGAGRDYPQTEAEKAGLATTTMTTKSNPLEGSWLSDILKTGGDVVGGWFNLQATKMTSDLERERLKIAAEQAKLISPTAIYTPLPTPPTPIPTISLAPLLLIGAIGVGTYLIVKRKK